MAPGFKLSFPFAHKRPQNATAVNDVGLIIVDRPVETSPLIPLQGGDLKLIDTETCEKAYPKAIEPTESARGKWTVYSPSVAG